MTRRTPETIDNLRTFREGYLAAAREQKRRACRMMLFSIGLLAVVLALGAW